MKPDLQGKLNLDASHSWFALIAASFSEEISFLPVIGEAAGTEPDNTRLMDICAIRSELTLSQTDFPASARLP